jgi:hypothetical protein
MNFSPRVSYEDFQHCQIGRGFAFGSFDYQTIDMYAATESVVDRLLAPQKVRNVNVEYFHQLIFIISSLNELYSQHTNANLIELLDI